MTFHNAIVLCMLFSQMAEWGIITTHPKSTWIGNFSDSIVKRIAYTFRHINKGQYHNLNFHG